MMWLLHLGNSDRLLAVEDYRRFSATSLSNDGWPLTIILVISDRKSLAIVLLEVSFSAGNELMYHLSVYQMTIIDVQILLKCLVAMRLANFRTLGTRIFLHKNEIHKRKCFTVYDFQSLNDRCRVPI